MKEAEQISSNRIRNLSSALLVLMAVFVVFVAYAADLLIGVVAYTYGYLGFCLLAAMVFGGAWRACMGKFGSRFAVVVFSVLAVNLVLPPPSERLLRSVMIEAPPGTDATEIAGIVGRQYEDSPYAMPRILQDSAGGIDRIHVSLLSQKEKHCTSVIFLLENGQVSQSFFSPD